jgi:very-short-patch-repair endonuclease
MWAILRGKRLCGFKFRRQFAIGQYIADLVCLQARLVIEIDGDTHGNDQAKDADATRTEYLEKVGFRVMRFWNDDVLNHTEGVVETILNVLSPSP